MSKEPKSERIWLNASGELAERINEWRRKHPDLPSRAEAIRLLVEKGLESEDK